MYISALLSSSRGFPISTTFGKIPFDTEGIWTLVVRGTKGMYYAGLRTGQPAILVTNQGETTTMAVREPYRFVLNEASLFFEEKLPGFDGNVYALTTSLKICERIKEKFYRNKIGH